MFLLSYNHLIMKIFLAFFLLIGLIGCNSSFNFESLGEEQGTDEDGDPVIIDPIDDGSREFGLDNSYCYGFDEPIDQTILDIDINIDYPEAHDISEYLPPIGSQGNQGSCVAWATGYYMKSFQENLQNSEDQVINSDVVLSPSFIFNQIKIQPCSGSQIADALDLLLLSGTPDLTVMGYDDTDCTTQPTALQEKLAEQNKIASYFYLDGDILLEQTKAVLLENKPVVIAISIDRNYFGVLEDGLAVYRKSKKVDGAHAMLVVGYDNAMNAFKVVNSWGQNWGSQGFVWIDYTAFEDVLNQSRDFNILCEAWVSYDVVDIPVPSI